MANRRDETGRRYDMYIGVSLVGLLLLVLVIVWLF
jgi:hypothetical protein